MKFGLGIFRPGECLCWKSLKSCEFWNGAFQVVTNEKLRWAGRPSCKNILPRDRDHDLKCWPFVKPKREIWPKKMTDFAEYLETSLGFVIQDCMNHEMVRENCWAPPKPSPLPWWPSSRAFASRVGDTVIKPRLSWLNHTNNLVESYQWPGWIVPVT